MSAFETIDTFIFDVDGVLTDGNVSSYASGEHTRSFYIKDGYAIEKAIQAGFHIIILSGGFEEGVKSRLTFLGIKNIFLGVKDKISVYKEFAITNKISAETTLYMGDDIPDYKMLKLVGLPTCPSDAAADIKAICSYISPFPGGRGAVRDVIEKVMKAQNKWLIEYW